MKIQRGSPGQKEIPQSDQPRGGESDSPGRKPSEDPIRINRTTASSKSIARRGSYPKPRQARDKYQRNKAQGQKCLEDLQQVQRHHLRINTRPSEPEEQEEAPSLAQDTTETPHTAHPAAPHTRTEPHKRSSKPSHQTHPDH